jgi:hypothetical protein
MNRESSPEHKEAARQELKERIEAFKVEAAEGIELAMLLPDEWRYVASKFTMDWATKKICIEADREVHELTLSMVQGIYNIWEASALWTSAFKSVSPVDRSRAFVVFYKTGRDLGNERMCCLLEADKEARDAFVTALKILRQYLNVRKNSPRCSPGTSPRKGEEEDKTSTSLGTSPLDRESSSKAIDSEETNAGLETEESLSKKVEEGPMSTSLNMAESLKE